METGMGGELFPIPSTHVYMKWGRIDEKKPSAMAIWEMPLKPEPPLFWTLENAMWGSTISAMLLDLA